MECNLEKKAALYQGLVFLSEIYMAKTAWQRTRGLLGRKALLNHQGLLIEKCHSVHMIGMKYSIELCYLDQNDRILKVIKNLKPWQFSYCFGANKVIEMPIGKIDQFRLEVGQRVILVDEKLKDAE